MGSTRAMRKIPKNKYPSRQLKNSMKDEEAGTRITAPMEPPPVRSPRVTPRLRWNQALTILAKAEPEPRVIPKGHDRETRRTTGSGSALGSTPAA